MATLVIVHGRTYERPSWYFLLKLRRGTGPFQTAEGQCELGAIWGHTSQSLPENEARSERV